MKQKRGNCYFASEALFHILGGKKAGWQPMRIPRQGCRVGHWFLKHSSGLILDASVRQFHGRAPCYAKAKRAGFLTRRPSRKAREMIELLTYYYPPRKDL